MRGKYKILVTIAPLILILDQWTKIVIQKKFYIGEKLPVIEGFFDITHIRNKGAAFGMLASLPDSVRVPFFFLMPLVALTIMAVVFNKLPEKSRLVAVALTLVMSGALGNVIDRIFLGEVVDFILFHWHYQWIYPAFNVADSAITVGVTLMMIDLFINKQPQES